MSFSGPKVLARDDFFRTLERELDIPLGTITEQSNFAVDLQLDSIALLEVLAIVDQLGVQLPEERMSRVETAGDLYQGYALAAAGIDDAAT
jgi:acyl carrier protein